MLFELNLTPAYQSSGPPWGRSVAQFVHGWSAEACSGRLRKSHRGRRRDRAFGISGEATSLLPLNIWRLWTHVRRRGNLFDLGLEMGCLVHQEAAKWEQQRLEAEVGVRHCVDWLPSLLGSLYPYGIRPSQENRGPLADLMFLADDEQLLARGAVVSMRHVLSRLSRMFRKFPATSGLHSESCSRFTGC